MFKLFTYIDYARKAKQGYRAPDELIADTSFGIIEGYFLISFIILGILSGGFIFIGFYYGYLFFKIFGILFLLTLIIDIVIFRFVKKIVTNLSRNITSQVKNRINKNNTIDIEVNKVE